MATKVFCDRCKTELRMTHERVRLTLEGSSSIDPKLTADLCKPCQGLVLRLVRGATLASHRDTEEVNANAATAD